jgi:hypothetical protein
MLGDFTWDVRAQQYRGRSGRFVSRQEIRNALDRALNTAQGRVISLAEQLRTGTVSLAVWQTAMAEELKTLHLYSAAAAKGGWAQMTDTDYGRVGRILRDQYQYLRGFASDIAGEKYRDGLDGRFLNRVKLYARSGRMTYHAIQRNEMFDAGRTEVRSVLHPAEHCDQCVEQARMGWVAIDDPRYIPVMNRTCLSNDLCTEDFR